MSHDNRLVMSEGGCVTVCLQQAQNLNLAVTVHTALLKSIALLLAQKLMDVGFFRLVWGNSKTPLQQLDGLLRFHDDERDISMLNCRWR